MKLFTLIVGVALIGASFADKLEETTPENEPITSLENEGKERQRDIPEVFLQLKYDKGELNRIYLTQYRKEEKIWIPSVASRGNLCSDLCHAGLGGEACGSSCRQLMPVGLQTALLDSNHTSNEVYGQPRYSVCPALCSNHLGEPLCNCANQEVEHSVNWSAVCIAFCHEGYTLNGCPTCDTSTASEPDTFVNTARILSTSEGWAAWCNIQCQQGQGGAACNCSRTPFQ